MVPEIPLIQPKTIDTASISQDGKITAFIKGNFSSKLTEKAIEILSKLECENNEFLEAMYLNYLDDSDEEEFLDTAFVLVNKQAKLGDHSK